MFTTLASGFMENAVMLLGAVAVGGVATYVLFKLGILKV